MKPPIRQIANQVSKVEVSWPAELPLPRVAPLMTAIANRLPDIPLPFGDGGQSQAALNRLLRPPAGPAVSPLIFPRLPSSQVRSDEPIFESVVEGEDTAQPPDFTAGIMSLSFE